MASSDNELEQQLLESGNKLVELSASVDELLPLLDGVQKCLLNVEQSPNESMQVALAPSLKALVDDKLLGHANVDVKVAVASCISEITRITAPEAPYDDDRMKEVFQLIVSSFENLSDKSSRSYLKRTSILETVAKVRSCVVMLDLECDGLIVEMFQHFLNSISDHHPDNVVTSMETIMSLVLEESEDISVELLSPLLACVKNNNKEVLPVAQKLAERVLKSCASKVKPYLVQAVKALDSAINDYSKVVAIICQDADDAEKNNAQASDENLADESKEVKHSTDKEVQDIKEIANEEKSEKIDPASDRSPQSTLSNGVAQTGEDVSMADSSSFKKREEDHPIEHTSDVDAADKDSLNSVEILNAEKVVGVTAEKEVVPSSPVKSTKPSDSSHASSEKEQENLTDREDQVDDIPLPQEVPFAEAETPVEKDAKSDVKGFPSKTLESASVNEASVSPIDKTADETPVEKEPCEKDSSEKEASPSLDDVSKKAADVTSDSGLKPDAHASSRETKISADVDVPTKDSEKASDSEVKPGRYARKKIPVGNPDEIKALTEVIVPAKDSKATSDSEARPSRHVRIKVPTGSSGEIKATADADVPMKDSEVISDTDVRPSRNARKKALAESSGDIKSSAEVNVPMKDSEATSDSEARPSRHARKKVSAGSSGEVKVSAKADVPMKDSETTSDSEAKPSRHARKKAPSGSLGEIKASAEANVPTKDGEGTSDLDVKLSKHSRKKGPAGKSGDNKVSAEADVPMKDSEAASDSEEKPLKQSAKKVDGSNKKHANVSSSKQEDRKKSARGKSISEKDVKKTSAKDNTKDTVVSPKSSGKSTKDVDKKETPKTDSKRKRTPGKEKGSVKDFGEIMVGSKVKVWWPEDREFYDGEIVSFDSDTMQHKVLYTDGDMETLSLKDERWQNIGRSDEVEETDQSGPEDSTETPLKKRTKIKSEERSKQKKVEPSPKKVGGGSSSKSKGSTVKSRSVKSDGKSKDENPAKSAGKSRDEQPAKSASKSEDASGGKSKDQTPKGGGSTKSTIISFKSPSKSKNTETQTPKSSKPVATPKTGKSKSNMPKSASASKDKSALGSDSKSSTANGSGKPKSGSSKTKEIIEDIEKEEKVQEEKSDNAGDLPEAAVKVKSPNPPKSQGTGKKRRRGVKG